MTDIEVQLRDILRLMKNVSEIIDQGYVATPIENALLQELHMFMHDKGRMLRATAIGNYISDRGLLDIKVTELAKMFSISKVRVYQIIADLPVYQKMRDNKPPLKPKSEQEIQRIEKRFKGTDSLLALTKKSRKRTKVGVKHFDNGLESDIDASFKTKDQ